MKKLAQISAHSLAGSSGPLRVETPAGPASGARAPILVSQNLQNVVDRQMDEPMAVAHAKLVCAFSTFDFVVTASSQKIRHCRFNRPFSLVGLIL